MQKIKIIQSIILLFSLSVIVCTVMSFYNGDDVVRTAYPLPKANFSIANNYEADNSLANSIALSSDNSFQKKKVSYSSANTLERKSTVYEVMSTGKKKYNSHNAADFYSTSSNGTNYKGNISKQEELLMGTASFPLTIFSKRSYNKNNVNLNEKNEPNLDTNKTYAVSGNNANRHENLYVSKIEVSDMKSYYTQPFSGIIGPQDLDDDDPNESGGSGIGTMPLADGLVYLLICSFFYMIFKKKRL